MIYITFSDREGYWVARITDKARIVAGPFATLAVAAHRTEQIAAKHKRALYAAWPLEFTQSEREYSAQLGVDQLPRTCWHVIEA